MPETSENNAGEATVHGLAHDVTENGSTAPTKAPVIMSKSFLSMNPARGRGPTRITVEHGYDHRHVGFDRYADQMNSENKGNSHHDLLSSHPSFVMPLVEKLGTQPYRWCYRPCPS